MGKFKDHPIWSKVIAGSILLVIGYIGSKIPGLYPAIGEGAKAVWSWVTSTTPIYNWLLILLALLSVALVGLILIQLFTRSVKGLTYLSYREDEFFGVKWRWDWGRYGVWNVGGYCPHCDYEVSVEDEYGRQIYGAAEGSRITCDHCGCLNTVIPPHTHEIEETIKKLVRRKARTDEWKTVVERQNETEG